MAESYSQGLKVGFGHEELGACHKIPVLPLFCNCFNQNIVVIPSETIIPSKCRTRKLVLVVGKAVKGARNFKCEDLQLGL